MERKKTATKVFASVYDVNVYRKEKRLTDVMVNKPIKYKDARLSSGELLEILLPDDGTVDDQLLVKVYSSGEVLCLPGHLVGNFIDCSSNIIGGGLDKSMEEIQSFTTGGIGGMKIDTHAQKNEKLASYGQENDQEYRHDSGFFDKTSSIDRNPYEGHAGFNNKTEAKINPCRVDNDRSLNDIELDDKLQDNHNSCYISMTFNHSSQSTELSASVDSLNASFDNLNSRHDEEYVTVSPPTTPSETSKEVNVPSYLVNKRYMSMKTPELPKRSTDVPRLMSVRDNKANPRPVPQPNLGNTNHNNDNSLNLNIYGVTEVLHLLSRLSLTFSQDKIISLNIDGDKLSHFSETQLYGIIGLSKFESRILYFYVRGWRPTTESKTNWREKKDMRSFSTMDLMTYLGYFGYAKISRFIYDYKVDGEMFMRLLEDKLLLEIVFDDETQLEQYELDDLVIRFFHKRERTHRMLKEDLNKIS